MRVDNLADDLALLTSAAREAGAIAMSYYQHALRSWDKEPNHPVTEAYIAVNTFLMEKLRGSRPGYGWLSEETADTPDRLERKRVFVVDPIDGTRAFMNGDPHFCVALAVLEGDQPVASTIYAPVFDEMFGATHGGGAFLNGEKISASQTDFLENSRMIGEPSMFQRPEWKRPWPSLIYPPVKPNSTAYRMALVADGRWDSVIVLWHKWDWDVAAATLLIREAGGSVTTHTGEPYVFNRKVAAQQSLIAAGPMLHEHLIDRCRQVKLPRPGDS